MSRFELIAFDADDTLWENERFYLAAQDRFRSMLIEYHAPDWIDDRLYEAEVRNLPHFGYGIKAFALSMIETAIELTEGRISSDDILTIIATAKEMLAFDIELLDHAAQTVELMSKTYSLMVITKGDLLDQEKKIARSGLASFFRHVAVLSDKKPADYAALFDRHEISPERVLMVGNSLRSDILPVLEIGGSAVYVPHEFTWSHESAERPPADRHGFYQLTNIGELPGLIQILEREWDNGITGKGGADQRSPG